MATLFGKELMPMKIGNSIFEERRVAGLSTYEVLQLMLAFGSLLVALIALVVAIVKSDNKK